MEKSYYTFKFRGRARGTLKPIEDHTVTVLATGYTDATRQVRLYYEHAWQLKLISTHSTQGAKPLLGVREPE